MQSIKRRGAAPKGDGFNRKLAAPGGGGLPHPEGWLRTCRVWFTAPEGDGFSCKVSCEVRKVFTADLPHP